MPEKDCVYAVPGPLRGGGCCADWFFAKLPPGQPGW